MRLGDKIRDILSRIGITPDVIKRYSGIDCCCEERREFLNRLSLQISRVIRNQSSVISLEEFMVKEWKESKAEKE